MNTKWIDFSISAYWAFNLSKPDDLATIMDIWKNNQFASFEYKLVNHDITSLDRISFNIYHLCYFIEYCSNYQAYYSDWYNRVFSLALEPYDLNTPETLSKIFMMLDTISPNKISANNASTEIIGVIYSKSNHIPVDYDSFLARQYNKLVSTSLS